MTLLFKNELILSLLKTILTGSLDSYYKGCLPEIQKCNQSGNVTACQRTDDICGVEIHRPIQHDTYFDPYDVRQSSDDDEPIPPETYLLYLNRDSVLKAIGARTKFEECSSQSEDNFGTTGDRKFSASSPLTHFSFLGRH